MTAAAGEQPSRFQILRSAARIEDLVLFAWMIVAAPLLARAGSGVGPFDPGQPVQGYLRLGAVIAALACLGARKPAVQAAAPGPGAGPGAVAASGPGAVAASGPGAVAASGPGAAPNSFVAVVPSGGPTSTTSRNSNLMGSGAIGPLTGGMLLVAISGAAAAGLPSWGVTAYCLLAVAAVIAARFALPPLGTPARRLLVTPFIVAAGGIFWSVLDGISAGAAGSSAGADLPRVFLQSAPAAGFLIAFTAVYYAMLVFAPRQVADREGGALVWVVRYGIFLAGIVVGAGWLGALGT